ncbi:hypothetical protein SAMD00019534_020920 [Acytostelium subglobosum LB1]|uniref:hypothetical protein n=1 Tax=Acytostelium subglobosum LB1 TaxID=1410327 RepID=UPI000644CF41|nr:hypothetical protein SAMD00019534_020920 [Acytostelium subglobosum LB1]GAM18917.1 hypothetical protein SAMD00019534_020920 [Acytostelium subglobosum LB1]|eukprot:XP_012758137.1 hypothetical protein SAMD00019534_020920 [Acytostelium subglobosum LB1]
MNNLRSSTSSIDETFHLSSSSTSTSTLSLSSSSTSLPNSPKLNHSVGGTSASYLNSSNSSTSSISNNSTSMQQQLLMNNSAKSTSRSNSSLSLSSSQPVFTRMASLSALPSVKSSTSETLTAYHEEFSKPVYDLFQHIKSENRLKEEFLALEYAYQQSSHSTVEGNLKYNTSKNRYTNIVPWDTTRVKLEKIDGLEGSDYINANFIAGGEHYKQYICTQGPLQNTFVDFWRMVWENGSTIVVMLSKELENSRPKCDRYWSESDRIEYDQFAVKMTSIVRDLPREIIIRTFTLTNSQLNQSRIITHYQYEGWPDHNAPNDTEPLRYLMHQINTKQKQSIERDGQRAPIVVHCSAGVGRTGTFCTVHIVMSRIDNAAENDRINFNIYSIVDNLRKQRPGMVQQLEQYLFCYATIADELKQREKAQSR